jgi:hypothetical protein
MKLTNAGLETILFLSPNIDVTVAHTVMWRSLAKRHQRAYILREKVTHS